MQASAAATEWSLLQNQFDSYEKYSLLIKLVGVLVLSATVLVDKPGPSVAGILVVLWMQDAIWKTFQARIESRLLELESVLTDDNAPCSATRGSIYQFNTAFLENRPRGVALLREYLLQAARPTVAFAHVALLAILIYDLSGG